MKPHLETVCQWREFVSLRKTTHKTNSALLFEMLHTCCSDSLPGLISIRIAPSVIPPSVGKLLSSSKTCAEIKLPNPEAPISKCKSGRKLLILPMIHFPLCQGCCDQRSQRCRPPAGLCVPSRWYHSTPRHHGLSWAHCLLSEVSPRGDPSEL